MSCLGTKRATPGHHNHHNHHLHHNAYSNNTSSSAAGGTVAGMALNGNHASNGSNPASHSKQNQEQLQHASPMDSPALTKGIVNGSITASGGTTSGIYGLGDHHSHHGMSGGVAGPALRNQNSASLSTVKQKMNGSVSGSGGTASGVGPGGTHYS